MKDKKLSINPCCYGCGKMIYYNPQMKTKMKLLEFDTGQLHDYVRCYNLLKQQGKDTSILKKSPKELQK